MAKRFGKAFIKLNGQVLESDDGATCDIGGTKRNTVTGNEVHGFTEEEVPSRVECDIYVGAETSLDTLRGAAGVPVEFEMDTGQIYSTSEAWITEALSITSGKEGGKVKVAIEGKPMQEVK